MLNELNQLQDTLEKKKDQELNQFVNSNILIDRKMSSCFTTDQSSKTDTEAIDQQFDEVLKFLAQTIDENSSIVQPIITGIQATGITSNQSTSSASPSSTSLSATPNSDSNSDAGLSGVPGNSSCLSNKASSATNDRSLNGGGSSNSSGIGEDPEAGTFNSKISNIATITQMQLTYRQDSNSENFMLNKQPISLSKNIANKRSSSDSIFMETVLIPSSLSLGVISRNQYQNAPQNISTNFANIPKIETDLKQVGYLINVNYVELILFFSLF